MVRIGKMPGHGQRVQLFPAGEGRSHVIFQAQAKTIETFFQRITNNPRIRVKFIETPGLFPWVDPQIRGTSDPDVLSGRLAKISEQTPVILQPGGRLAEGLSITKAGDLNSLLDKLRHHYQSLAGEQSLQYSLNRPSVDVYASADTGVTARLIKLRGKLAVRFEIIADRGMSYFAIVDIKVPN